MKERDYEIKQTKRGEIRFPYRPSRYCRWVTWISSLLLTAIFLYLLYSSSGTYLSAWFLSLALAVALLLILSFPRNIDLDEDEMALKGILEATYIPYNDIKRIHPINKSRLRFVIPLIGSYGFGGYFGYYIDLRNLRTIRVFASRLSGLIMIQTIYNERILISCERPEQLISMVRERITDNRQFDDSAEAAQAEEEDD